MLGCRREQLGRDKSVLGLTAHLVRGAQRRMGITPTAKFRREFIVAASDSKVYLRLVRRPWKR